MCAALDFGAVVRARCTGSSPIFLRKHNSHPFCVCVCNQHHMPEDRLKQTNKHTSTHILTHTYKPKKAYAKPHTTFLPIVIVNFGVVDSRCASNSILSLIIGEFMGCVARLLYGVQRALATADRCYTFTLPDRRRHPSPIQKHSKREAAGRVYCGFDKILFGLLK